MNTLVVVDGYIKVTDVISVGNSGH